MSDPKPVRVPREVQREAYRMLAQLLEVSKDTDAIWQLCPDEAVSLEAWSRACDSLIAIARKRGCVE